MKLKDRIAVTFAALTSGILIFICVVIYFLSRQHLQEEFFHRLAERADIEAQYFLKQDQLSQQVLEKIREQHQQKLPLEQDYVVNVKDLDSLQAQLPPFIRELITTTNFLEKEDSIYVFKMGDTSGVVLQYKDSTDTYLTFVTAVDQYGKSELSYLFGILFGILACYFILVFFVGRLYALQALNPVTEMAEKMKKINTSNLHIRLETPGPENDELSSLILTFNSMLDRISTSLEAQNNFISNASHQLKNPLTVIMGEVEVMLQQQQGHPSLVRIEEEAERLNKLVLKLLHLAQTGANPDGSEFKEVRMDELILDIKEELQDVYRNYYLHVDLNNFPSQPDALTVWGNENLLKIAFSNVVENAFKFSGQDVWLSFQFQPEKLAITIKDNGIGIPEQALPQIFDPFFRADNAHHLPGYGVGLPLTKKIVDLHAGTIEINSPQQKGTIVTITLPLATFN